MSRTRMPVVPPEVTVWRQQGLPVISSDTGSFRTLRASDDAQSLKKGETLLPALPSTEATPARDLHSGGVYATTGRER